jgi:hypothetical protein
VFWWNCDTRRLLLEVRHASLACNWESVAMGDLAGWRSPPPYLAVGLLLVWVVFERSDLGWGELASARLV